MATNLGELAVRIGANTDDLMKGLQDAKKGLRGLSSDAREAANVVGKFGLAAAGAGAAMAAALVANSVEAAKEISNLSKIAGLTAPQFQKLAVGARSVGIEQDKLADILKDVNDKIGDFQQTGGGAMADFFENIAPKVGITANAFRDLSGDQALQLYVSSLEKANLSQADMTFYMEAIASDSTALLPLLKNNGAAFAEQAKKAEALGLALSEIDTANLKALSVSAADTKDIFSSFGESLSAKFAPTLNQVALDFQKIVTEAGGIGPAVTTSFNAAIDAGAFLANAVDGLIRVFSLLKESALIVGNSIGVAFSGLASAILNGPVEAVNFLIEKFNGLASTIGMNELPTVSLSEWGKAANASFDGHASQIEERFAQMHQTLMQPLAGDNFKRYVENAQQAAIDASAALENGKIKESESLIKWGETFDEILAEQREEKRQKAIDDDAFFTKLAADGEQWRIDQLAESHEKQQMLDKMNAEARKAALGDLMNNLASLMGSKSRKMFEIGKVAAIANTVVSTMQGAQQAYTALSSIPVVGPALGVAAAGAAIAAGAVRVQAINAQSFSKGTVSGAAAGQTAQNIGNQVATGGQQTGQTQYIRGLNPNDLFSGSQIIDLINNAQETGSRLVVL